MKDERLILAMVIWFYHFWACGETGHRDGEAGRSIYPNVLDRDTLVKLYLHLSYLRGYVEILFVSENAYFSILFYTTEEYRSELLCYSTYYVLQRRIK